MKFSYNWLKEFVDVNLSPRELAEALTMAGFEVEEVVEQRLDYPNVVVGKVLKVEKHPNADKLTVCQVSVNGDRPLNIICGAPNVAEGQTVPVALVGAELPNGMKIRKARIRGVESEGMICSEEELNLAEKSEGIWVLPEGLPLGAPLAEALAFQSDAVLDIGLTPNRPDVFSHIGLAREVAAIAGTSLHIPEPKFPEIDEPVTAVTSVEIRCPETCPRYAARVIRNLTVGPSPEWMQRRLMAAGMRPINNLVDITNYVMLETGQPLHAFDYQRLAEGRIVVRESSPGERFITLDENEHELQAGTVLICDAEKPVAIGGIMGGLNSEVTGETTTVLLESAYFDPESIRRSARYLGIKSEASQRFGRGADPNGVLHAQARATQLMVELAGGEVYRGVVDEYPRKIFPVEVEFHPERINALIGVDLSREEMIELLRRIQLEVKADRLIAPTYRPDLRRTADIAEEVARLYGYERIPLSESSPVPYTAGFNPFDDFVDDLKDVLIGVGLQEVVTNSMVNARTWEQLTGETLYPILNPISQDMDGLRNSLIPSLLRVLQWNINRQVRDLAIFEINTVFGHPGSVERQPIEETRLGIALTGLRDGDLWYASRQAYDFYDIKGIVEYLTHKISLDTLEFIPYDNFAVEEQAVKVVFAGRELGFLGRVRPSLQQHFDIETPVFVAELKVKVLHELSQRSKRYREIPRYPWVDRDLAVVVDQAVTAEQLLEAVRAHGGKHLVKSYIFDVYTGKPIESGKKSVGIRLIFQSPERTLTEEEVNQATATVLKALERKFGAHLRT